MLTPCKCISLRQLTKRYPGVVALEDVSLDVERGALHAIVGENGAGKSTLMKIVAGIIPDYEGELLIDGRPCRFAGTREAEAAGVRIIHQELSLVGELSVAANIFLGRELRTRFGLLDERAMGREAGRLLDELECRAAPEHAASELRVGDQQLVEIAKALSRDASIVIMDEPTSALTAVEVERLDRVIARLRARGVTILYISHKLDEVFRLADRITVLRDGRLIRTLDRAATDPREIMQLMVGRELATRQAPSRSAPGAVALEVENLSLPRNGHARAWRLRDISFRLSAGEIVGIAGLMGAGRTELLECLFGASPEPPQGRIVLDGREVRFRSPAEAKRAGMALVTEDRARLGLFMQMNVAENSTIGVLHEVAPLGLIQRGREQRLVGETIRRLGIRTSAPTADIADLSGGNQQKVIIGRWLLTRPRVLLLDDPTRGVDVGAKADLYAIMDQLCAEGMAILVTSSELPELLAVSDRILVLCEGRLSAEFPRAEATQQGIMEAATGRLRPALE